MTAKEFAKEFINNLSKRTTDTRTVFSMSVYNDDPQLKILKRELEKAGYSLILEKPNKIPYEQEWKVIKI